LAAPSITEASGSSAKDTETPNSSVSRWSKFFKRAPPPDKRRILAAVDQASEPGEIGRILRREGIYHAQLSKWRRQRAQGIDLGLSEKARGVKGPSLKSLQDENRKLNAGRRGSRKSCGALALSLNFKKRPRPCSSR
jgi:transposase-like protein